MEQFGEVKYAVLCKAGGESGGTDQKETHRGTGFVRFREHTDAESLLEMSRNLELKMDQEHLKKSKDKKPVKKENSLLGASSLISGELELNGRRLVIIQSVAKSKVGDVIQSNKDSAKGVGEDRRNLALKKEGLLNEKEWVH